MPAGFSTLFYCVNTKQDVPCSCVGPTDEQDTERRRGKGSDISVRHNPNSIFLESAFTFLDRYSSIFGPLIG